MILSFRCFLFISWQRLIKAQVTNETPATSTPSKDAEEPASGAAKSKDHAEPTAASASKDTDTAHATEEKAATKATLPPKKAAAKIDAAATENGKEHADVAEHEDTGVNVLDLGEEERRKLRAAKFGLPDEASEEERKKARAAKFGLPDEDADNEKRKARAAKFGITDDSVLRWHFVLQMRVTNPSNRLHTRKMQNESRLGWQSLVLQLLLNLPNPRQVSKIHRGLSWFEVSTKVIIWWVDSIPGQGQGQNGTFQERTDRDGCKRRGEKREEGSCHRDRGCDCHYYNS